jgi:methylase of polypeptide subunit release factors
LKISKLAEKIQLSAVENVYSPSHDSFLFLDYLDTEEFTVKINGFLLNQSENRQRKILSVLDCGSGTGILGFCLLYKLLSLSQISNFELITLTFIDINPAAIKLTEKTVNDNLNFLNSASAPSHIRQPRIEFRYYVSDLFKNVPEGNKYDIVVFNPPYLPDAPELINDTSRKIIDDSWDGGDNSGNRVLLDFFSELKPRIYHGTPVFFISSSRANLSDQQKYLQISGFEVLLLQSCHYFFEDIILFEAKTKSD